MPGKGGFSHGDIREGRRVRDSWRRYSPRSGLSKHRRRSTKLEVGSQFPCSILVFSNIWGRSDKHFRSPRVGWPSLFAFRSWDDIDKAFEEFAKITFNLISGSVHEDLNVKRFMNKKNI